MTVPIKKENKKERQYRIAHLNAKALAERLFEDFRAHPEDLGPRFSWAQFPDTMAGLARANCFTWFPHDTKITKALKGFAAGVAYNAAQNCLVNSKKAVKPSNQ